MVVVSEKCFIWAILLRACPETDEKLRIKISFVHDAVSRGKLTQQCLFTQVTLLLFSAHIPYTILYISTITYWRTRFHAATTLARRHDLNNIKTHTPLKHFSHVICLPSWNIKPGAEINCIWPKIYYYFVSEFEICQNEMLHTLYTVASFCQCLQCVSLTPKYHEMIHQFMIGHSLRHLVSRHLNNKLSRDSNMVTSIIQDAIETLNNSKCMYNRLAFLLE